MADPNDFVYAAEAGDVDEVRRLLDHPSADAAALLMARNGAGDTALQVAAYSGNVDVMHLLLAHPSADAAAMMIDTGLEGASALIQAAQMSQVDAMRLLLDHPAADPAAMLMQTDDGGEIALIQAVWSDAGCHSYSEHDLARRMAAIRFLLNHPSADAGAMLRHASIGGYTSLLVAAWSGFADAVRLLLEHPAADPAVMIKHVKENGRTSLLEAAEAGQGSQVDAMRLLLDHPSADPGRMLMHADGCCSTALLLAASGGHVDAMLLLLDHPSANSAAMMAIRSSEGASVLTVAAEWAVGVTFPSCRSTRSCAPLLLLLRRVAEEPQPCDDAQQAHMSEVMKALCQGTRSQALFASDQPNAERDECIRLLLEFGADIFAPALACSRPVVLRIARELSQLGREPYACAQLINAAVVGMALTRQQAKPRPNAA
ncbi:hypothetical protein FOA52_002330 [Chlamydomonas sp. UWO 241]|nr:hypothetical protein FOA52_002330 [Chlamydomonas sp. UWO 241]